MQITKNITIVLSCLVLSCLVAISLSATWGPGGWGGLSIPWEESKEKCTGARYARLRYGRQEFWAPLPCLPPSRHAPYRMCNHTSFETQA